jgi:hypothetical protein
MIRANPCRILVAQLRGLSEPARLPAWTQPSVFIIFSFFHSPGMGNGGNMKASTREASWTPNSFLLLAGRSTLCLVDFLSDSYGDRSLSL